MIIPIVEGGPVYVERIDITGNTKSSEKVLRRELRVAEGELFTFQKLVRSRQRLFNLGFFDEVNVSTDQGSTPDKIVVNIDVKERATGVFSIGAGYSSLDSLFATLDVSQRNLFGRGQEVFLRFRIGTQSRLVWSASPSPTSSTSPSVPGLTSTTGSGNTTTSRKSVSAATSGPATRSRST